MTQSPAPRRRPDVRRPVRPVRLEEYAGQESAGSTPVACSGRSLNLCAAATLLATCAEQCAAGTSASHSRVLGVVLIEDGPPAMLLLDSRLPHNGETTSQRLGRAGKSFSSVTASPVP